jgi:hypothetical protein
MLTERRERIEQGLKDADAARRDREAAADQRQAVLAEARREANDILARAQRLSDETREQGVAETRTEIERLRRGVGIDAERQKAPACRAQVADSPYCRQGGRGGDERRERSSWMSSSQVTASSRPAASELGATMAATATARRYAEAASNRRA